MGFAPNMIAVYELCPTVHSVIVNQAITSNLATAFTYSATHVVKTNARVYTIALAFHNKFNLIVLCKN